MFTKFAAIAAAGFASLAATTTLAQEFEQARNTAPRTVAIAPLTPMSSTYFGYDGYHSSTAAEGYLNGVASVYQGVGQFNYLNSLANINNETAYSMALENHLQKVDTFFAARRMNRAARAAEAGPMPTSEQLAKAARDLAPARLTAQQMNPATGQLHWPAALQGDRYEGIRDRLQELFTQRSLGQLMSGNSQTEVTELAAAVEQDLQDRIQEMTAHQYMQAKNFLRSLSLEAELPSTTESVATR